MRPELPSGSVTFLFTDVEGSTRLLHGLGAERYAKALAEHRRVIRAACSRYGAVEVDTQGDAFFFAFATAPAALAAAAESTDVLASGLIQVRIGLHTGTPLLTDEGYVGADVHFGARVAASAHGGQIVLSKATQELLDERFPLIDLGEHRLKDIAQAVSIFQLGDGSFPPLKTISNTNLPRPASSFVGRESELAEVLARVEAGARLVSLTGPGGSGKTRLALEAAASLVSEYKAGVFWVGLAALRDPALVTETISQILGAKDGLTEHIGEREMLLLLDNLEQVIEAAPELSSLLFACPNLALLITSRELLRVQGEVEYPVPPLAEPEAVSLFCERAQLEPTEEIAELCVRLDNLPLAVELAAARAKALSPAQILQRLSQRLDLLKGGRDADPRQQTLRATIEWSYDLLSEAEKLLFARLAVFAGGCTLDAAEEVAGADLDTLQSLVEKSLVRFSNERYWMLETIREYADARQLSVTSADPVRDRQAGYFARLADCRWLEAIRGDSEWRGTIQAERANLHAALEWSLERGQGETALAIVSGVWPSWLDLRQGRQWAERALALPAERVTARRAAAMVALGQAAQFTGETRVSRQAFEEALMLYRDLDEPLNAAACLTQLADIALEQHDVDAARRLVEESVALRGQSDSPGRARALATLGEIALVEGDLVRAAESFTETIELLRAVAPESVNLPFAIESLGDVHYRLGESIPALEAFQDSLRLVREIGDPALVIPLEGVAAVWETLGRSDHAARLAGAAERFREVSGFTTSRPGRVLPERIGPAWSEGRRMSVDEAIDYALRSID